MPLPTPPFTLSWMKLHTERLVLREVAPRDIGELCRHMNNIRIAGNLVGVPHPYPESEGRWWVDHAASERSRRPRTEYILAITRKKEDLMIGEIILSEVDRIHKTASLVYWVAESCWRQGIATEAALAMMGFAFRRLRLRRLEISAFAENTASHNLALRLGFTYEGTKREAVYAESTGKVHDDSFYSILAREYFSTWAKRPPPGTRLRNAQRGAG